MMDSALIRVPYDEVVQTLASILNRSGMKVERAQLCARLFANASRDGVPSHGLNRFGLMMKWIRAGTLLPNAELTRVAGLGGLERWDGGHGPGPWNACQSMKRAIDLARKGGGGNGIACIALRNTNHWMRAGNYGWQAADAGCIGICWTNTIALMPAWGGRGRRVGNNPLVIAVPRASGAHVVLDMAMSQYSMGKLGLFKNSGTDTPLPGGFDRDGNETRDPAAIISGGAAMPIGAWKGSGLGILLDMVAAVVAGGQATHQIRADNHERGVSQMFIAIDAQALGGAEEMERIAAAIVANVKEAGDAVLYPGERSLTARRESEQLGVAVEASVWEGIQGMKA